MLCAGKELAAAASKALGAELQFENISQYVPCQPHPPCLLTDRLQCRSQESSQVPV
jgi:hypothetical protein